MTRLRRLRLTMPSATEFTVLLFGEPAALLRRTRPLNSSATA